MSDVLMEVFVKTMMGETHSVQTSGASTVLQLKMKIHQILGMFPDQQVLMFLEEELDDDDTLDSYNIQEGATIKLFPKVASGFIPSYWWLNYWCDFKLYQLTNNCKINLFEFQIKNKKIIRQFWGISYRL